MKPEQTLLIVGGKSKIVEKAKGLGLDVVLFQAKGQFRPDQQELADAAVLVDYTDWSALGPLARGAHEAWRFPAVLSLTEPGLDPAARVNDMLGLGGTSYDVSHRFTDKWLMRRHLESVGAPTLPAALASGEDSLRAFGREHGYPFIVKPTTLTASLGVFRVEDEAAIDDVWRRVCELRASGALQWADFFTIGEFMMEPYVPGPEYSVEGFSFAGRHVALAVTEKHTAGAFVEVGHALPAPLDRELEDAIVEAATTFLDAIGFRDGPTHTEVKVGPDGPIVLESHNRVGGDRINELVHSAYGIDMDTYAIGWPFRLVEELRERPEPKCAAATVFFFGESGRVKAIEGADEVRSHPDVVVLDVNVAVDGVVAPVRGNWDRAGQVLATGPDARAALRTCEQLVAGIRVVTEPKG
jgi:ATP-grasp domain/L-amino acid ligase C-terminal domain 2/ATP-grasp N-terminal domain